MSIFSDAYDAINKGSMYALKYVVVVPGRAVTGILPGSFGKNLNEIMVGQEKAITERIEKGD